MCEIKELPRENRGDLYCWEILYPSGKLVCPLCRLRHEEQLFNIRLDGLPDARIVQQGNEPAHDITVLVAPDSLKDIRTFVVLPQTSLGLLEDGEADVSFIVENIATGEIATNNTSFRGPGR